MNTKHGRVRVASWSVLAVALVGGIFVFSQSALAEFFCNGDIENWGTASSCVHPLSPQFSATSNTTASPRKLFAVCSDSVDGNCGPSVWAIGRGLNSSNSVVCTTPPSFGTTTDVTCSASAVKHRVTLHGVK
jgi:hypothetical protein